MRKTKEKKRSWVAIIFGLVFFFAGVGFLFFLVIPDLADGWRMQYWTNTQASLKSASLKRHSSDDSDTYKAIAQYEYIINGQLYTNNRVSIAKDADNIGDYQENLGRKLKHYYQSNQKITIWYDPQNPSDSIINREIRWGLLAFKMIFVIVFGGAGFLLAFFGYRIKKDKPSKNIQNSPWLERKEWVNGAIKSNAKTGMIGLWFISAFWNAISFPTAISAVPKILADKEYIALMVLLFPLVGLGLLYWAIKSTLEWKRFGATPLTMDPYPGSIGGQVGGQIKINTPYNPAIAYKVTLSCIHSYMSGSGKSRSQKESVRWQDDGYVQVKPMANHINAEFCFDTPDNLPASESHSDSYNLWRLTIESKMEGVDLNRNFEIPVYPNKHQSAHINFKSPDIYPAGIEKTTAESLLPLSQTSNTKELYYPMFRNFLSNLAGIIFGGVFAAVGVFLWQQGAREGFMLYFMSSIFTTIGVGVVISATYMALNSLTIKMNGMNLHYKRKFLFFNLVNKIIPYNEVTSITSKKSSSSNSGGKNHIYYKVYANARGKKYMLSEKIDSSSKKDLVIEYFNKEFFK